MQGSVAPQLRENRLTMIARRNFSRAIGAAALAQCMGGASPLVNALTMPTPGPTTLIRVGPGRPIQTLAAASRLASRGTTIEVDAGEYRADVAVWEHDDLSLRASGGRVRLIADGMSAESKGIWVVRANNLFAEGFDFHGAAVPGRNGAGIRLERGSLRVRDCSFTHNQMGILTSNDPATSLDVENCEFAYNMRPDGHNHNLYCGSIRHLSITGSYIHHGRVGHLLKSRAAQNHVFYNRLTDESGGSASYELEFPNGGIAYVVGNIIAQNAQTENRHLISFGAEGYRSARNEIYLVNNTLVTPPFKGASLLRVMPGADVVQAVNNLLVGAEFADPSLAGTYRNNFAVDGGEFTLLSDHDYRLRQSSRLIGRAIDAGSANGVRLHPVREYLHPRGTGPAPGAPHNPGAMQSTA